MRGTSSWLHPLFSSVQRIFSNVVIYINVIVKIITKFYSLYIYVGKIGLLIRRCRKYIYTKSFFRDCNLSNLIKMGLTVFHAVNDHLWRLLWFLQFMIQSFWSKGWTSVCRIKLLLFILSNKVLHPAPCALHLCFQNPEQKFCSTYQQQHVKVLPSVLWRRCLKTPLSLNSERAWTRGLTGCAGFPPASFFILKHNFVTVTRVKVMQ